MGSLKDFGKRSKVLGAKVISGSDILVKKAALAIEVNLVIENPVLTGRSKANWFVQMGSEPTEIPIEAQPAGSEGETRGANERFAISSATAVLAGKRSPGTPIYITNNLPYIIPLNEGLSPQTDPGFIERSVEAGRRVFEKGKILE